MTTTQTEPVLTISDEALTRILELRAGEDDADALGLRIEVTGVRGVDYTYDLAFEVIDERETSDLLVEAGLPVIVPAGDVDKLQGATLDLPSTAGQPGLVLRNPNRPTLPDPEDLELTGELADDIRALLDQRINPAIAAHGGFAELVGVEGGEVYVRLGGGCQGCAMSRATVAAGIEQTLKEHLPGVTQVIDVTDHASGDNPYYS
ncbi:MAG: NifU family protein [Actinomycetota bacterium]